MAVAGTRFPGGTYRIAQAENDALCRAVGAAPDPDGRAHPIYYYIAAQAGMGLSVDALLALCDFDVADGPLMTGSNAAFEGELMVERTYTVTGEIASLVRKPSRAFGAVDLLSFNLALADETGAKVAACTNQWVLPRRGGTA
jgi:hypothetical protein